MKRFSFPCDALAAFAFRVVWACYFLIFTWLLINRNPMEIVRPQPTIFTAAQAAMPWSHLVGFGVLAALTFLARWRLSHRLIVALLVLHSLATEFWQTFVPSRHPQLLDLAQNFAGIAVGCGLAWAAGFALSRWFPVPGGQADLAGA